MGITITSGITELSNFKSNTQVDDGIRGLVPAPLLNTPANYVLRADATWGAGGGNANIVFVPVIRFVGSSAGGAGQIFTNSALGNYSAAEDIELSIRGATPIWLYGGFNSSDDFNLNGNNITVNYNLPQNARLFIQSKVLDLSIITNFYILESGDNYIDEIGNFYIQSN